MPTYRNNSTISTAYCTQPLLKINPGASVTIAKYIRDKPDFVELMSHTPTVAPWTLLATVNTFPSAAIDVTQYDEVTLYAATTGAISVEANEDTQNAMILPPGYFTIKPSGYIGAIKILSRIGTGSVYVWGLKGENQL